MSTCRSMQEDLELWLDGALSDEAGRALERHLLDCPFCRDWLAMRRELGEGIRSLGPLLTEEAPVLPPSSWRRVPAWSPPLRVAAALLTVLGVWVGWSVWGGKWRTQEAVLKAEVSVVDDVRPEKDIFITDRVDGRTYRIHCRVYWNLDGEDTGGRDE